MRYGLSMEWKVETLNEVVDEFEIAETLIRARQRAGLSQAEVAKRMGTTQSVVARLESGRSLPSSTSLARYAAATGSRLHVELLPGR
ncbi:Transcriptional regulator [Magnetospirillum sp. SS-4]|nr:Transcriptional regulator [Magnetospirillum sp. SS-4]